MYNYITQKNENENEKVKENTTEGERVNKK